MLVPIHNGKIQQNEVTLTSQNSPKFVFFGPFPIVNQNTFWHRARFWILAVFGCDCCLATVLLEYYFLLRERLLSTCLDAKEVGRGDVSLRRHHTFGSVNMAAAEVEMGSKRFHKFPKITAVHCSTPAVCRLRIIELRMMWANSSITNSLFCRIYLYITDLGKCDEARNLALSFGLLGDWNAFISYLALIFTIIYHILDFLIIIYWNHFHIHRNSKLF